MKNNLIYLFLCIFLFGTIGSCSKDNKTDEENPLPLPTITCYNVKELKTLLFDEYGVCQDTGIEEITFDAQNRILTDCYNDGWIDDFDYSDPNLIRMNQRSRGTNRLCYYHNYILNNNGSASWWNIYDSSDNKLVNSQSFLYNKTGQIAQVFEDSKLIRNYVWENECIMQFEFNEQRMGSPFKGPFNIASYTKYPDNRNMGKAPFLRDKSYYLVDTEKYNTSYTRSYKYLFDSLNRPILITIYQDSLKFIEEYYTYY